MDKNDDIFINFTTFFYNQNAGTQLNSGRRRYFQHENLFNFVKYFIDRFVLGIVSVELLTIADVSRCLLFFRQIEIRYYMQRAF